MPQLQEFPLLLRAAMDGKNVDQSMYDCSTKPPSPATIIQTNSWANVLSAFYAAQVDDQFIPPLVRVDSEGRPVGCIRSGDVVIYTDFRTDRAKPLTAAFLDVKFGGQVGGLSSQARQALPTDLCFVTMTHYDDAFTDAMAALSTIPSNTNATPTCPRATATNVTFLEAFNSAVPLNHTYAEVIGAAGISQLVVAESEKWRAVTWFKVAYAARVLILSDA